MKIARSTSSVSVLEAPKLLLEHMMRLATVFPDQKVVASLSQSTCVANSAATGMRNPGWPAIDSRGIPYHPQHPTRSVQRQRESAITRWRTRVCPVWTVESPELNLILVVTTGPTKCNQTLLLHDGIKQYRKTNRND
jgi:hypothetical protein